MTTRFEPHDLNIPLDQYELVLEKINFDTQENFEISVKAIQKHIKQKGWIVSTIVGLGQNSAVIVLRREKEEKRFL